MGREFKNCQGFTKTWLVYFLTFDNLSAGKAQNSAGHAPTNTETNNEKINPDYSNIRFRRRNNCFRGGRKDKLGFALRQVPRRGWQRPDQNGPETGRQRPHRCQSSGGIEG